MAQTDLDIQLLRRSLSSRVVGCQVLHYDLLGSTMDEARRLSMNGHPEGTVVIAEEQTAGRGRFNRAWISPRGQNLSFSVVLAPSPSQLCYLNMAAALAVSGVAEDFTGHAPTIKWPNDVRINGRKLAGILIETSIESEQVSRAVAGIGLNVNFDPSRYPEIAATATSLLRETGQEVERTAVLLGLLQRLDDLYRAVKGGRSLTGRWSARLDTLGRVVRVQSQSRVVEGRAERVDEQGNLVLALPDGSTFTAVAGEVTLQV